MLVRNAGYFVCIHMTQVLSALCFEEHSRQESISSSYHQMCVAQVIHNERHQQSPDADWNPGALCINDACDWQPDGHKIKFPVDQKQGTGVQPVEVKRQRKCFWAPAATTRYQQALQKTCTNWLQVQQGVIRQCCRQSYLQL